MGHGAWGMGHGAGGQGRQLPMPIAHCPLPNAPLSTIPQPLLVGALVTRAFTIACDTFGINQFTSPGFNT